MKGEWILKEVYFQDGWPSVIRDPVRPEQEPVTGNLLKDAYNAMVEKKTRSQKLREAGFTRRPKGWEKEKDEQEPVAWRTFDGEGGYEYRDYEMNENYASEWAQRNPLYAGWVDPLYTAPPQRKPLDETTVFFLADKYLYEGGKNYDILEFARAIEFRHGIDS